MIQNLTDEELVKKAQSQNERALTELYNRYKQYSKQIAFEYYTSNKNNGVIFDDIYTAAFESIEQAVRKFSCTKGNTFFSYWRQAARNEILHLLKEHTYSDGATMFAGISLDDTYGNGTMLNEERFGFEEPYANTRDLFTELMISIKNPDNHLTPRQQQIFLLSLDGYTKKEISRILNLSYSTVLNQYRSAVEKLQRALK